VAFGPSAWVWGAWGVERGAWKVESENGDYPSVEFADGELLRAKGLMLATAES
jgi:hypothetical protein